MSCILFIHLIYIYFYNRSSHNHRNIFTSAKFSYVINYFFQGKLKILLNATGDGYVISNLATITSCLASGAKVVLLLFGANVLFVQAIYCVVSLVQMLFIYIYVRAKYPWINFNVVPDRSALTQKNSTLIHQICSLVTNSTDVLLLSVFCSLEVASIYAVYNMIYSIIYNLSYSVNGGLQFIFGNSYCKGTKYYTGVISVYETYYLGLCSALMGITYATILPFLALYTAGADINYIDLWIPVLFTAVELLRAMRNSAVNTISVAGHFRQTRNHAIIESAINLVLSLVLVNVIGMYGVLLGTVVAFAYRNIVAMHYSNVHILGRNSLFSIKIVALNVVLMAMMMLFFNMFRFEASGYLEWIGYASVVAVVAFVVFFVANSIASPTSFKRLASYVRKKFARKTKGNSLEE